jgi:hypothetical protein
MFDISDIHIRKNAGCARLFTGDLLS